MSKERCTEPYICTGNCCMEAQNKVYKESEFSSCGPKGYSSGDVNLLISSQNKSHKKGDLRDGGTRQTYSTGAQKEDSGKTEGKGRYDLLPVTAIRRIAEIYRKGAIKYADRNWEKGIPLSRFLDSAKRHLDQYQEGMQDEDHLAQAAWNLLGLLHTEEMIDRGILPEELDDLPNYMPVDANPEMWRKKRDKKQETDWCAGR